MIQKTYTRPFFLLLFAAGAPLFLHAQQLELQGTVVDFYNKRPIDAVSVISSSGKGTISDSLGKWHLQVGSKDSVWFSFLGKNTQKFPVDTIATPGEFDIALHIDAPWLPEVKVRNKNYLIDSLQNRQDYANVFNFKKPGIRLSESPPSAYVNGGLTVGFDLDAIIDAFKFRKNREMLAFQQRLLWEEHDNYVLHRFSKRFIKEITHIDSTDLENFMRTYKPPYEMALMMNDIELGYYIEQSYSQFMALKKKE